MRSFFPAQSREKHLMHSLEKEPVKILVLGGTGETGRTIIRYLKSVENNISITIGGRKAPAEGDIPFESIELNDKESATAIVSNYDLVMAACGPMEKLQPAIAEICIAAGVDLIDISDSAPAMQRVLAMHETAVAHKVRIYSGMGFAPGITSLMLRELAEKKASGNGVYRTRICMGTAYGGGRTSPYAMLDNLKNEIPVFRDGRVQLVKNPWRDARADFQFLGKRKKLTAVSYATPEIYALADTRYPQAEAPVSSYDIRCTMEGFPLGFARFVALINKNGRFNEALASMFYKSGRKMKGSLKADPDNQVVVYPDDSPEKGIVLFGDVSSYDLTAAMAVSVAECLISGRLSESYGVYTVELLNRDSCDAVTEVLKKRSFYWKSMKEAVNRGFDVWGWLERDSSDVDKLRHYGENWYTVKIHPRMKDVQSDVLFGSRVWKVIKEHFSKAGLALFTLKMMLRWRSFRRILKNVSAMGKEHNALVRDISMFASGYSLVRDLKGRDEAFELYKEMFLTAGSTEMCWFMPRPETFGSLEYPEKAVVDYFKAMLQRNMDMGFLEYECHTRSDMDNLTVEFHVSGCIYAGLFNRLNAPELADLIRLEEKQEIERLISCCCMTCDYRLTGNGSADIVFTIPAET
jgi:hypothetical protein